MEETGTPQTTDLRQGTSETFTHTVPSPGTESGSQRCEVGYRDPPPPPRCLINPYTRECVWPSSGQEHSHITWMKLGGNLPLGHDALRFYKWHWVFFLCPVADTAGHTKLFFTHPVIWATGEKRQSALRGWSLSVPSAYLFPLYPLFHSSSQPSIPLCLCLSLQPFLNPVTPTAHNVVFRHPSPHILSSRCRSLNKQSAKKPSDEGTLTSSPKMAGSHGPLPVSGISGQLRDCWMLPNWAYEFTATKQRSADDVPRRLASVLHQPVEWTCLSCEMYH